MPLFAFCPPRGGFCGGEKVRWQEVWRCLVWVRCTESVLAAAGGQKGDRVAREECMVVEGVEAAVVVVDVSAGSARGGGALVEEVGEAAGGVQGGEVCQRNALRAMQSRPCVRWRGGARSVCVALAGAWIPVWHRSPRVLTCRMCLLVLRRHRAQGR